MGAWIDTSSELERFAAELRGCRAIALDTEADSLHHHFAKVCLIQLASDRGEARLIDPLAIPDLAPLDPILADPEVLKALHGADYDVSMLKRDFGFRFSNLFDTMIAARFLGLREIGLQALARQELGIELQKDSQKDDWSLRPLTPRQQAYALADVEHLLAIQGRLGERLRTLGRLEWVEEESAAVAELAPARRDRDADAYQRIKGASRLSPRSLAILRELHAWREGQAAAADKPAFRVLGNDVLLALAAKPPAGLAELGRVRGVLPRLRGQAPAILQGVERALALPENELPRFPRTRRPSPSDTVKRRVVALRAWRDGEAQRLDIDVSVVLPGRLLERVAEAGPRELDALEQIEGLRRWRLEAFGSALLEAVRAA